MFYDYNTIISVKSLSTWKQTILFNSTLVKEMLNIRQYFELKIKKNTQHIQICEMKNTKKAP